MNRRTIMIDQEIESKVRDIQAQLILQTNTNWSFSTVANLLMLTGIAVSDKLTKDDLSLINSFVSGEEVGLKRRNVKKILLNVAT